MAMDLKQAASERIIIAAHRGVAGGNIPCNTIAAYDAALSQGADMIEIDANMSADGTLFVFHPKMEKRQLGVDCNIREMTDEQIAELRYQNYDRDPTEWGLCKLDEVFERYKNRCFINVDKFWDFPKEISNAIRRHNMLDQIVVKTSPKKEFLDIIESYAPEIPYLPIIKKDQGLHEMLKGRNINYIGVELVFDNENNEIGTEDYVRRLHADGKLVWANAIVYNYKAVLAGGHSDDYSIAYDPEGGWGWLADRGYDIIQTDWTLAMRLFLEQTGRRFKNKNK